jgi:hypothetical protein
MNARARWEGPLFFLIALGASVAYAVLDRDAVFWDEYYHLLAARSWASDGTFAVGGGAYARATWLSAFVGWLFRVFGESIVVARTAAAFVVAAWALVVFLWTRREAGRLAAWLAGLTFALCPIVLVNGVMVRFYATAGLLIGLAAVASHVLVDRVHDWRRGTALVVGALACGLLARRITPLARLWGMGLIVWVGGVLLLRALRSRHRAWVMTAVAVGAVAGLVGAWWTGWVEGLWAFYREAPPWGPDRATDIRWYDRMIRQDYPILWGLFPVASILALRSRPKLAGLCLCVLCIGFGLLSGAGPKAERYALPTLPYFFVIWGIAAAELLPMLARWISSSVAGLGERVPRFLSRVTAPIAMVVALGFVLLANPGFVRLREVRAGHVRSLDRDPFGSGTAPDDWDRLAPALRASMDEVDAVVTSNSLQILYHVGDYDFEMRPTVIAEVDPPREFGLDPRTGRPTISTLESLQTVMRERPTGLVVGEARRWGHAFEGFTPDVAEFVYANLEEVSLPERLGVRAYRWGPSPDR